MQTEAEDLVILAPYGRNASTGEPYPAHPTQQTIMDWARAVRNGQHTTKGIPVLYCQHGVNSGGTRGMLTPVIEYLLEQPGLHVLIGRKDFNDLRLSAMQTFFDIVPASLIVEQNVQEHWYKIEGDKGVSTVFFRELKDVRGLGSQEFAVIVVCEAHEISEFSYRTLKQRCRQGQLPTMILLEGNGPSQGHWLLNLTNRTHPDYDPDITMLTLSSYENWNYMSLAYRTSLEQMPPTWQKRYLLGEAGALPEGTPVYPAFVESVHVGETSLVPDRPVVRGWDFGYRRAACTWVQRTDDNRVLFHREWMAMETPEEQFIDGVIARTREWFGSRTCMDVGDPAARNRDPHGVATLQRLSAKGITLRFRQSTYAERIPLINRKLSEMVHGRPSVTISPNCRILIEALLGGYHYPKIDPDQKFSSGKEVPHRDGWFEHMCLDGKMRLRTLHGYQPIQSLVGNPCWVWSYSHEARRMVPAKLGRVWKVGERPVIKLTYDGGELVATGDHQICLRDGSFVPLERLRPGDELMPLYETKHSRGKSWKGDHWYRWLWLNDGSEGYEHRIVYAMLNGHLRHKFNVDHIDGNIENNEPDNLQLLSSSEHSIKTRSWRRGKAEQTSRNCRVCGVLFQAWHSQVCGKRCHAREQKQIPKERWIAPVNHRVVSLEPQGVSEVYDFSIVKGPHNAVCEGIVVHNCNAAEYVFVNLFLPSQQLAVKTRRRIRLHEAHVTARQGAVVF